MYLRCAKCHETIWIQSLGSRPLSTSCESCGRSYRIETAADLGATGKEQYARATEFAETNRVDLPTAYSVLLGILSLETVREGDRKAAEATRAAHRADDPAEGGRLARCRRRGR